MAHPTDTPYAGLTPDVVLDALDSVGLRGDGRLIQLNSYENRVFQVFLEDGTVVVAKFYRPARWTDAQILEEHDFSLELAEAEIPVVAPISLQPADGPGPGDAVVTVLGHQRTLADVVLPAGRFRFAVTPRCAGHGPELDRDDTLEWIGRFIGRLHAVGGRRPFVHRRELNVDTYGVASRDWLLAHDTLPDEVSAAWRSTVDQAIDGARRLFDRCPDAARLRLHGDCHPGNILWRSEGAPIGPHFVDLDDAVNGCAMQDLWMLLSGDRTSMTRQLGAVLAGYEDFMDFDPGELVLVEALRTLRMIHHSAWLAQRWNDPAFPAAFPWFAKPSYWAQQIDQLREQIEAMDEPPLSFYPRD